MIRRRFAGFLLLFLLALICLGSLIRAVAADGPPLPPEQRESVPAPLSDVERKTVSSALESSKSYPRDHIVLVWPESLDVSWYPESKAEGPEELADWLERCYGLCVSWLKIDPDRELNDGKGDSGRSRLVFIHNGMRDYNLGGSLPRPVIGLRDFSGVGSEDWFGWLTHELSHEFLLRFPSVVGTREDNEWHEALCDYLRYWQLKESGMPEAAAHWLEKLRQASPRDKYQGGAKLVMDCHDALECASPAEFWAKIGGAGVSKALGQAPWTLIPEVAVSDGQIKLEFDAVIDGAGSFTFRDGRVFYEHFTWQYPERVSINGQPWSDLDKPFEWDCAPDYASAKVSARRGRDTVVVNPHDDRLVLYIDDFEASSGRYQLVIVMEREKQPAP